MILLALTKLRPSGFVRWASEQVEVYAETFRRQVYGVDQDGRVVEESLEMTKAHGAMVRNRPACSSIWVLADHAQIYSCETSVSTLPFSSTASCGLIDQRPSRQSRPRDCRMPHPERRRRTTTRMRQIRECLEVGAITTVGVNFARRLRRSRSRGRASLCCSTKRRR